MTDSQFTVFVASFAITGLSAAILDCKEGVKIGITLISGLLKSRLQIKILNGKRKTYESILDESL